MHLTWNINPEELDKWRKFVDANISNDFVKDREERNLLRTEVDLSKDKLWYVHVGCQVTTQQRSGPNSSVSKFMDSSSPALNYEKCKKAKNLEELIQRELEKAGLRRFKTIASFLTRILNDLENGGWKELEVKLKSIEPDTTKEKEQEVANYISQNFPGLGLKQSRNYIQWLGLARYEIPLDSRVTRTLRMLNCSFVPKAGALSDESVYLLVQSGLQLIASKLNIYPCILDACIFSSYDEKQA